ncbi:hypothetical protein K9M47_00100 [Candidatus Gracilibacteria bacterium]|nr:hypothetical protein [Candidatus Gracilibacteria bacterium]MCF7898378.1 hypothetical protein [Candidatus Paceibacterota bacterium]
MKIAQYLIEAAEKLLRYEGNKNLPQKLADTEFYLAKADDDSIMAFGVIKFEEVEYRIGTKKLS